MARGGKRTGAGRHSILDPDPEQNFWKRLTIASAYEKRIKRIAICQAKNRLFNNSRGLEVENDLDSFNKIPLKMLRKSDNKNYREIALEFIYRPCDDIPKKLPSLIEEAIFDMRNRIKNLAGTKRLESIRRPQGVRKKLLVKVSAWASRRYGVLVKPGYVEDCVEEYRAFLKL
jgi:hypothetical protein